MLLRKHRVPAQLISECYEKFLEGGQSHFKNQLPDRRDEEIRKLKEKLVHLMFAFDAGVTANKAMQ